MTPVKLSEVDINTLLPYEGVHKAIPIWTEAPYLGLSPRGRLTNRPPSGKTTRPRRFVLLDYRRPDMNPRSLCGMSLARYLYQIHLWRTEKRLIPPDLEVDHINDDPLDDRIENYQLLTSAQNLQKSGRANKWRDCQLVVCYCGKRNLLLKSERRYASSGMDDVVFQCDHICASHFLRIKLLTPTINRWFKENQILMSDMRTHLLPPVDFMPNYYPMTELGERADTPLWNYTGIADLRSFIHKADGVSEYDRVGYVTEDERLIIKYLKICDMLNSGKTRREIASIASMCADHIGRIKLRVERSHPGISDRGVYDLMYTRMKDTVGENNLRVLMGRCLV